MNLLLDTHILLWNLNGSDKLPPEMKNLLFVRSIAFQGKKKGSDFHLNP
jgi:hypothetical protein